MVLDIRFLIKGCGADIATSSIATELVMGATLDEVMTIDDEKIAAALDGLPEEKMHCSNMAASHYMRLWSSTARPWLDRRRR